MTEEERLATIGLFTEYNTDFAMQDEVRVRDIKSKFIIGFGTDVTKNPRYVLQLLDTAFNEKNAEDVENALIIASMFNLISKDYTNILLKLMESDWHFIHEDIASIFQELKLPNTVDCLFNAALSRFEYLEYDDSYALAVKCIWALGQIGTEESTEKLILLAQSQNEVIRENALNQLKRRGLTSAGTPTVVER